MMNATTAVISGIMTEPTRYALIIGFVISVILFLLNEWAKRRYLIHEKMYSLRLERFESLLQELFSIASIYVAVKIASEIDTADVSSDTKGKIVVVNRFFEKIFSKSILNEEEVLSADTPEELRKQKLKLIDFFQYEGIKNLNNVQNKATSLHLIMPDSIIQVKANEIAININNYIQEADKNKNYLDNIKKDLTNLVDSMRTYLPSLSLTFLMK